MESPTDALYGHEAPDRPDGPSEGETSGESLRGAVAAIEEAQRLLLGVSGDRTAPVRHRIWAGAVESALRVPAAELRSRVG